MSLSFIKYNGTSSLYCGFIFRDAVEKARSATPTTDKKRSTTPTTDKKRSTTPTIEKKEKKEPASSKKEKKEAAPAPARATTPKKKAATPRKKANPVEDMGHVMSPEGRRSMRLRTKPEEEE